MAAFVQARWFTKPATPRRIDLAVIHSMELDERADTAEACANYFRTVPETNKASAHTCLDTNSRVDCVRDEHVAYAAPGANHNGVHVELAGRARQTRDEWLDAYSLPMVRVQLAAWLAEKHRLYGIPLVYLDAAALRRGERGVTTHRQVSLAFKKSDHTDPGAGFPLDVALAAARRLVAPTEDEMTPEQAEMLSRVHHELVSMDPGTVRSELGQVKTLLAKGMDLTSPESVGVLAKLDQALKKLGV